MGEIQRDGICEKCGKAFKYSVRCNASPQKKYCSIECRNMASKERNERLAEERKLERQKMMLHHNVDQLQIDAAVAKELGMSYGKYKEKQWWENHRL